MPKAKDVNHYNWQQFIILGTLGTFFEWLIILFEKIL